MSMTTTMTSGDSLTPSSACFPTYCATATRTITAFCVFTSFILRCVCCGGQTSHASRYRDSIMPLAALKVVPLKKTSETKFEFASNKAIKCLEPNTPSPPSPHPCLQSAQQNLKLPRSNNFFQLGPCRMVRSTATGCTRSIKRKRFAPGPLRSRRSLPSPPLDPCGSRQFQLCACLLLHLPLIFLAHFFVLHNIITIIGITSTAITTTTSPPSFQNWLASLGRRTWAG